MSAKPKKLAKGLWRWTERHPEWHPGEFGKQVQVVTRTRSSSAFTTWWATLTGASPS